MNERILSLFRLLPGVFLVIAVTAHGAEWSQHGGDIRNSRFNGEEMILSPANVGQLTMKWSFETGGDVSGTPTVDDGSVYFGDWAGNIFRVDAATGAEIWSVSLADSTTIPGDFTRHAVSVAGDYAITGNQSGRLGQGGAKLVALDKETGETVWVTQIDPDPNTIVTSAPTVFAGVAYVGVASFEEGIAAFVPEQFFPCCFFRGSVVAVDAASGQILWQTYTVPAYSFPEAAPPSAGGDGRFSGNGVWGSAPAIDVRRNQLYVATGNNYSAPVSYLDCIAAAGTDAAAARACNPAGNYFDSILALDLDSGAVVWDTQAIPFDTWNVACSPFLLTGIPGANPPGSEDNCVYGDEDFDVGPDFDFGQAPMLLTTRGKDYVGVGQKSGVFWSLDPENGDVVWETRTGPGGLAGGHQWGSASDGSTIYTSNANSFGWAPPPLGPGPYQLIDGTYTQAGIFSAIDSRTGAIKWQTANPSFAPAGAPAAIANGVMYACSGDASGYYYAFDAGTGVLLWSFPSGGTCGGGASIVDGTVYWGSGYSSLGGPGNNKVYAFGLATE